MKSAFAFWTPCSVAKWVEGTCYFLHAHPNQELKGHVDYLVDLIERAQQKDGYLNIHFVVNEPDKRWSNLRDLHELYNGGHLIEAALAHHQLTGSDQFLNVMLRFVHYCASVFGPAERGKKPGYPGHPEIELALLRLHDRTGDQTSYDLARFFINERGRDGGKYYVDEQAARGEHPQLAPSMMPKKGSYWYMQAHALIKDQATIEGHAVRAGYLLTAVADLVEMQHRGKGGEETQDLLAALYRLWNNMVNEKMYVTGGTGSIKQWEGFSDIGYFLPQATDEGGCYAETCSAISVFMVAERMLALKLDGTVADVAERALYNASVTAGMSVDGHSFTYVNQLASSQAESCERHSWFQCACCPPNVLRSLGIIGGFFWSPVGQSEDIAIHQYFDGQIEHGDTKVKIATKYPWDGRIDIDVAGSKTVHARIPGWAREGYTLSPQPAAEIVDGYVVLREGTTILTLPLKPRLVASHPYTGQDTLTLVYGPLVYCLEDVDNAWESNHFKDLCLSADLDLTSLKIEHREKEGVTFIHAPKAGYHLQQLQVAAAAPPSLGSNGHAQSAQGAVGSLGMNDVASKRSYEEAEGQGKDLVFVPYYYRANRRKEGVQMRTSLRRKV